MTQEMDQENGERSNGLRGLWAKARPVLAWAWTRLLAIEEKFPDDMASFVAGITSAPEDKAIRARRLLCGGVLGVVFAFLSYWAFTFLFSSERLVVSLTLLVLSLPTLFILWVFRTHDVREQINISWLEMNLNLINSEQLGARCIGLAQLVAMKHRGLFKKEVDFATRKISLVEKDENGKIIDNADLQEADLRGADLFRADLREAHLGWANLHKAKLMWSTLLKGQLNRTNLRDSDLTGAILTGADMWGANLQGANLESAKLCRKKASEGIPEIKGANLSAANLIGVNLHNAKLRGAIYDDETKFPEGFDPKKIGMIHRYELIKTKVGGDEDDE